MSIINKVKVLTVIIMILALAAGCAGGPGGSDTNGGSDGFLDPGNGPRESAQPDYADEINESTDRIMQRVVEIAMMELGTDELPPLVMDPIMVDNAPFMLGLLQDDFVAYVIEATVVQSQLGMHAFQVSLVRCKDKESAGIVNDQIVNNFDSGKWIEVMPEQSLTVVSGSYVFLAVGTKVQTEVFVSAFKTATDATVSAPNIFYKGETGGEPGPIEF